MADSILTQITMAGGAINLAFNNIEASYSDGSNHLWATNANMMIIYYNTTHSLAQPVLITKYMYNRMCSTNTNGTTYVSGWYLNNGIYTNFTVIEIYGINVSNLKSQFRLQNGSWCILVS